MEKTWALEQESCGWSEPSTVPRAIMFGLVSHKWWSSMMCLRGKAVNYHTWRFHLLQQVYINGLRWGRAVDWQRLFDTSWTFSVRGTASIPRGDLDMVFIRSYLRCSIVQEHKEERIQFELLEREVYTDVSPGSSRQRGTLGFKLSNRPVFEWLIVSVESTYWSTSERDVSGEKKIVRLTKWRQDTERTSKSGTAQRILSSNVDGVSHLQGNRP